MDSCHGFMTGGCWLQENTAGEDRQELNYPEDVMLDKCWEKMDACLRLTTQNISGLGQLENGLK